LARDTDLKEKTEKKKKGISNNFVKLGIKSRTNGLKYNF